jgi:hypothetical protein
MTRGEACLAFFLLLELAIGTPFGCWIIYGNERKAWVDLWLLLSKLGKRWHEGCSTRKAWRGFDLQKAVVTTYTKSCYYTFKATSSSPQNGTSNLPWSPLRWFKLKEQTDQPSQHSNHTKPGFYNRVRIHATHNREHGYHDSSTLYRVLYTFPKSRNYAW